MCDGDCRLRRETVLAQPPAEFRIDALIRSRPQLPLKPAGLAGASHRAGRRWRDRGVIHDQDLRFAFPRKDVSLTPPRSRLNIRRRTWAEATSAEELTRL